MWFYLKLLILQNLSAHKILWHHVDWCKICIHLRSMNVRQFGVVEVTEVQVWLVGRSQWHGFHVKFHENLPTFQKHIRENA